MLGRALEDAKSDRDAGTYLSLLGRRTDRTVPRRGDERRRDDHLVWRSRDLPQDRMAPVI
jgi:hypothetical protein